MSDREENFEWGYRLGDGSEHWEQDYGTDGSWISHVPEYGIPTIDIYDSTDADKIRSVLTTSSAEYFTVLRRKVTTTRGPIEEL